MNMFLMSKEYLKMIIILRIKNKNMNKNMNNY